MDVIRPAENNVRDLRCDIGPDRFLVTELHNLVSRLCRQITEHHRIVFADHRVKLLMTNLIADRSADIVLVAARIDLRDQLVRRIMPVDHEHLPRRIQLGVEFSYDVDPRQDEDCLNCHDAKHRCRLHIITADQTEFQISDDPTQ